MSLSTQLIEKRRCVKIGKRLKKRLTKRLRKRLRKFGPLVKGNRNFTRREVKATNGSRNTRQRRHWCSRR